MFLKNKFCWRQIVRSEVFPVLARRGLNSGGVSHGAQQFLAIVVKRNRQFFFPNTPKSFWRKEDAPPMYWFVGFRQNKKRSIKFSLRPVVYVTVEFSEECFPQNSQVKNNMIIWIAETLYIYIYILSKILPSVVRPYLLEDHLDVRCHQHKRAQLMNTPRESEVSWQNETCLSDQRSPRQFRRSPAMSSFNLKWKTSRCYKIAL